MSAGRPASTASSSPSISAATGCPTSARWRGSAAISRCPRTRSSSIRRRPLSPRPPDMPATWSSTGSGPGRHRCRRASTRPYFWPPEPETDRRRADHRQGTGRSDDLPAADGRRRTPQQVGMALCARETMRASSASDRLAAVLPELQPNRAGRNRRCWPCAGRPCRSRSSSARAGDQLSRPDGGQGRPDPLPGQPDALISAIRRTRVYDMNDSKISLVARFLKQPRGN